MESKTKLWYVLQGNYGYGCDDLVLYENLMEAKDDLAIYNENEIGIPHRIIRRREPK